MGLSCARKPRHVAVTIASFWMASSPIVGLAKDGVSSARSSEKSTRAVDLRVALFDDENALVIYDAQSPADSTEESETSSAGYVAYWMNYHTSELFVFGRRLFDRRDVGHALRNLRRDLGVEPSGLLDLDPQLFRARSLAEFEDENATAWHSVDEGVLAELLGPGRGVQSKGDALDTEGKATHPPGRGSVADAEGEDQFDPDQPASCPPETMGGGRRRFIPDAPDRTITREGLIRAVLNIVGCGGECTRCTFA